MFVQSMFSSIDMTPSTPEIKTSFSKVKEISKKRIMRRKSKVFTLDNQIKRLGLRISF